VLQKKKNVLKNRFLWIFGENVKFRKDALAVLQFAINYGIIKYNYVLLCIIEYLQVMFRRFLHSVQTIWLLFDS